jgi:hypothetical protein
MMLATSLSMLFFARAIERGRTRDLAAWAVVSSVAVWIHYFAIFPIVAEAAFLLVLQRARRAVLGALAAVAVCSAAAIPLLRQQTGRASWIHDIPLNTRIEETMRQLVTAAPASPWAGAGSAGSGTRALWWLAAVVLTAAVVAAIRLGSPKTRRGVVLALGIGGAAIVIPLVGGTITQVTVGRGDYLIERNVLAAWLPLAIVVAAGLGTPRMGRLGLGIIAVLCAAGAAVVLTIIANPLWQRDDWRLLVRRLPAGPTAVLVVPAYQSTPVRYYDRSLGPAVAPVRTREIIVVSSGNTAGDTIRLPRAFSLVSTEHAGRWELRRLRSKAPALVSAQPGLLVRTG